MKKMFIGILIASILASPSTAFASGDTAVPADVPRFVLGDVDMNGEINSTDYLRMKENFLGHYELKGSEYAMADVNFDGVINATDYISLKKSLLKDLTLDDSYWANQDEKERFTGEKNFAIQFSSEQTEGTVLDIEGDVSTEVEIVTEGIMHYPDWDTNYKEYINKFPKERIIENHKGEKIRVKYKFSYVESMGSFVLAYQDDNYNNWYFDANGQFVGVLLRDDILVSLGSDTAKSESELIEIGNEMAHKMWPGKTFKLSDYGESQNIGYRFIYTRYINGIKTTDCAEIWVSHYGDLRGYLYHDAGLDNYDFRSFNVNDDISMYREKIISLGLELTSNKSILSDWYITEDQIPNLKITIDEPWYGISADGKLAGYTHINFKDESMGFLRIVFIGFYAEERNSVEK